MRLAAKDLAASVVAAPGTARPVRLRIGGLAFGMEPAEAIDLASRIADVVTELKNQTGEQAQ